MSLTQATHSRTDLEEGAASAVRVLAIPGSLRRDSWNRRLLEAARQLAPAGVAVELFDLRPLPFYDGDVEAAGDPPEVREFKVRIRAADALVVATPEYNGTVPGLLQNAIDWASRPRGAAALDGKPVATLGASPGGGGTAGAQRALRQTLANAGAEVLPLPPVVVSRVAERFDDHGTLRDDGVADELRRLFEAVAAAASGRRGEATRAA